MGFLSGPLGAGAGAGAAAGAGVSPVASVAPPPTNNLMNDLMPKLLAATNPQMQPIIAQQMAKAGMNPDQFKASVEQGSHIAKVMQPQRAADAGMVGGQGSDQLTGGAFGDLMKPIGQPQDRGKTLELLGKEIAPQGVQIGKGQAQPNPLSGIFNQEKATPSVSESMQPIQGATEKLVGRTPPTWRGDTSVPGSPVQPSIAPSPGQMPIAPPVVPPEPSQTLPEALKKFISVGNTASAEGLPQQGTSIADTVVPNSARAGETVTGTSPTGSLSPLGGELLQPSSGTRVQPTWTGQTSYQLHGGATRADALKNMRPEFMHRMEEMYGAAPPEVQRELGLTSAYRDVATQKKLYDASGGSGSVAKPGHSEHNYGQAADLYGFGLGSKGEKVSDTTRQWVHDHAKEFGLGFPVKGEPWHIEQLTPEGKRMPLVSPGMVPDEIGKRGEIPQIGLKQRDPTAEQGMASVRGLKPEYRNLMASIGQSYGVDPNYLQRVAMIESGGNPNAHNDGSGADGMFQFVPGTAKQYRLENPKDVKDSIRAASELAMDNAKSLKQALGRDPSWAEVYLAHQQGSAGAAALLKNPDGMAVDTLGRDAVIGNGGTSGMTNQEFANLWIDKYNGTKSAGGGGPGDTTASTSTGEQFGPTYDPRENPLNQYPAPPKGRDRMGRAPLDLSSALDKTKNASDANKISPPGAVAPQTGNYRPDADMMKLMMMMLLAGGGGGGVIPSIGQLMSGQGGGGRGGQANG